MGSLIHYHAEMSVSNMTEAVLAELGTPHERVTFDIRDGSKEHEKPDFLKLNPNGFVPTIVHDGTPIWESAAITMYLGETFGVEAGLYPELSPKRGEAMMWIVWSNTAVGAGRAVMAAMGPTSKSGEKEKALGNLAKLLGILNTGLEGRQFLLGDDYTLADTHMQSVVHWLGMVGADLKPVPNVSAWLQRCDERPALRKLAGLYTSN